MADANQEYFDAQLRHQIGVRRYTAGEVKRTLEILDKADAEIAEKLRIRLGKLGDGPIDFTTARWKSLAADVQQARAALWRKLYEENKTNGGKFAEVEVDFETRNVQATLPVRVDLAAVDLVALKAALNQQPFAGGALAARNLQQWFDGLSVADQQRIIESMQLAFAQGESVEQALRRIVGTRAGNFEDGVLAMSRRNAEAVVRTWFNNVSNRARESVFEANEDIIVALKWNSTLDGRTSAICRGRDGAFAPVGKKALPSNLRPKLDPPGARPPAHPSCRSVMVSVFDPDGIMNKAGERPFVRDARTRRMREKDFRQEAIQEAGGLGPWRKLTPGQRNGIISKNRKNWAAQNIGQVPPDTTYNDWMKRQPAAFQSEVLGVTKARLFRKGGLTLDQFIDRRGNELTLKQLARQQADAFENAGLDPADYA